jgi:hypothetical protein
MDAKQLTPEQRARLFTVASVHCDWLGRMLNRMNELRWDQSDPAFREAKEAHQALKCTVRAINESTPAPPARPQEPQANKWSRGEHQPSLAEMGVKVPDLSQLVVPGGINPWKKKRR